MLTPLSCVSYAFYGMWVLQQHKELVKPAIETETDLKKYSIQAKCLGLYY